MRVQSINTNLYKNNTVSFTNAWWKKNNKNELKTDTFETQSKPKSQEDLTPPEHIPRTIEQEPKIELNANDMILSYKLADCLHRLDDKSVIYLASKNVPVKAAVKRILTSEDSFLPEPKNIENIYIFDLPGISSSFADLMIAKDGDKIITYGQAKNLTRPDKIFTDYKYNNSFQYNDVLELACKVRLKFIQTNRESNIPMYDAKYPAESFLSENQKLTGGVVINKNWNPDETYESIEKLSDIVKQKIQDKNNKYLPKTQDIPHRTFKDIAGMNDTIEQVKKQILYPMLYPKAFPDITNCGTIFYGPPGTGKTLLAQAIIGEAKERKDKTINFMNIDGQSIDSKWIGDTEDSWRKIFKEAVKRQPCILFIDEIDAVLTKRTDGESGGDRHRNSVVSQFLTLISNIEKNKYKIWIIGATNRPELIDDAIKRTGRIGNMIEIKRPDAKGCFDILNHYLKNKNIAEDFDRKQFAQKIYKLKYTGADISNLVNKARDNMYERLGIYKQMDNNTFIDRELDDLQYTKEDFEKSIM